jgi:hypothetical protein
MQAIRAFASLGCGGVHPQNTERDLHTWTRGLHNNQLETYDLYVNAAPDTTAGGQIPPPTHTDASASLYTRERSKLPQFVCFQLPCSLTPRRNRSEIRNHAAPES